MIAHTDARSILNSIIKAMTKHKRKTISLELLKQLRKEMIEEGTI